MTKHEADALNRYVAAMQARLGLAGWSITRRFHPDDHLPEDVRGDYGGDSCIGYSDAWPSVEQAEINIACDKADYLPAEIACHELLHVLLSPLADALERLQPEVGASAWRVAYGAYKDAEELAVRRLTSALMTEEDEQ